MELFDGNKKLKESTETLFLYLLAYDNLNIKKYVIFE